MSGHAILYLNVSEAEMRNGAINRFVGERHFMNLYFMSVNIPHAPVGWGL